MNYAFLPDLSALTILIVILILLRRNHPHHMSDIWLLGLFLTLVEAVAHTFYAPAGVPNKILHLIVVDCYLLAGLVFIWAGGDDSLPLRLRFISISLNALPLLAVNTLYGLHIKNVDAFYAAVVAGIVIGVTTSVSLRRSWWLATLYLCGWTGMGVVFHEGDYRLAVYWSLSCVYTIAALNFRYRLPRQSTGRLAILTGFSIWALCFLSHPWVVHYPAYADIASHVWNMQKSLILIGMLLVMLEEQVSNNKWLALHDELTGLPNRRLFEIRLADTIERSRKMNCGLLLFLLDLNGFKKINDSQGHQAGDQVLCEVAKNLCETVKDCDTLARLGGDEFVMIVSELEDSDAVVRMMEAIQCAVEKPIVVDGQQMSVTASLGTSVYPDDAEDATTLLRIADQRMYALKQMPSPMRGESYMGETVVYTDTWRIDRESRLRKIDTV